MSKRKPMAWSCDERSRDRQKCRNPYGCHCAEITALQEQLRRQTARVAALDARPAAAPALEGEAAFRRCDSNLVDVGGECLVCDAIQGEACRKPESRKNPRTKADGLAKWRENWKNFCRD